jgi:hypothetical protein
VIGSGLLLVVVIVVVAIVLASRRGARPPVPPVRGAGPVPPPPVRGAGPPPPPTATPAGPPPPRPPAHRGAHQDLAGLLGEWSDAGLLRAEQIDPILRHEEAKAAPRSRFPLAAEAVGYVGAALVVAAVSTLVANNYDDIAVAGRVAVFAVPAVLLALAGWWVGERPDPAFGRLGSVAWAVVALLVMGTLIEVFVDVIHDGDPPEHGGPLFVGAGVLVWGVIAYALRRRTLQLLVVIGASVATALGVVNAVETGDPHPVAYALTLWALGMVWFAIGSSHRVEPFELPVLTGAAAALIGAQILRPEATVAALWLGLATAAVFVGWGIGRAEVTSLLVGAAGLFQWSPQIAIYYLEDTLGIEATLLVVGLVLLGMSAVFTKLYRRARSGDLTGLPGAPVT